MNADLPMSTFASAQLFGILAALGGGLLVGVQRERHKHEHLSTEPAGVRTFALVALVGAVAAYLGAGMQWLGGAVVAALAVVSYMHRAEREPGLTTEMALFATYLLGALAMSASTAAAGLFVVLAVLLQTKQALHHFTRSALSERELSDALLLAASVLVILPLLPDRAFDPYEALNPRRIWLFAVMVMGINAIGYIALRALGAGRGLLLAGFLSGFISSTATIAAMGQRARADPSAASACAAAALLSTIATTIQLALLIAVAAPSMLQPLALPLGLTGAAAILIAALSLLRHRGETDAANQPKGRAFNPAQALLFAGIVTLAAFVGAVLRSWIGTGGVLLAAAAVGFADVHAAAISISQVHVDGGTFAFALAAAHSANCVVKCVAAGIGGRTFAMPVVTGVIAINLTLLGAVWLTSVL